MTPTEKQLLERLVKYMNERDIRHSYDPRRLSRDHLEITRAANNPYAPSETRLTVTRTDDFPGKITVVASENKTNVEHVDDILRDKQDWVLLAEMTKELTMTMASEHFNEGIEGSNLRRVLDTLSKDCLDISLSAPEDAQTVSLPMGLTLGRDEGESTLSLTPGEKQVVYEFTPYGFDYKLTATSKKVVFEGDLAEVKVSDICNHLSDVNTQIEKKRLEFLSKVETAFLSQELTQSLVEIDQLFEEMGI